MGVMFVPQQEAWLVERMGKFNTILEPGLNFLIPVLDKVCSLNPQKNQIVICSVTISFFAGLGEICTELERDCHRYPWPAGVAFFEKLFLLKQKNLSFIQAISMDNVAINIDGVLYLRVMDPYKVKVVEISEVILSINTFMIQASYGIEDPEFAITQLAQTTMRSEIGKISLDMLFKVRRVYSALFVYKMMIIMTTPIEETKENLTMPSMQERENLNIQIVRAINAASEAWGIQSMRWGSGMIHICCDMMHQRVSLFCPLKEASPLPQV